MESNIERLEYLTNNLGKYDSELASRERKYRDILEYYPEGIAVQADGKFEYINPEGARMLGFSKPSEVIGKPLSEFFEQCDQDIIQSNGSNGNCSNFMSSEIKRKDGSKVKINIVSNSIEYDGKEAIILVTRFS